MAGPYLNTGVFQTRVTDNDLVGPKEELGVWRFEDGGVYRYVKSGALIPRGEPVVVDTAATTAALIGNQVLQMSTATGVIVGIAETTLANLSFGWITCYGPATARVTTNVNPGTVLGSGATTGVLAVWNTSSIGYAAVALQTGLSAGSAVFVTVL